MTLAFVPTVGGISLPNADLEHHLKFVGTTSDNRVPTPVEMANAGK